MKEFFQKFVELAIEPVLHLKMFIH